MTTGKTILILLLIGYAIIGILILLGDDVVEPERHRFSPFIGWWLPDELAWIIYLAWPVLLIGDWILNRREDKQAKRRE